MNEVMETIYQWLEGRRIQQISRSLSGDNLKLTHLNYWMVPLCTETPCEPQSLCDKIVIKRMEQSGTNGMECLEIKYSSDISNLWEIRPDISRDSIF